MEPSERIDLETSEGEILQAASRIFSAYVTSNRVSPEDEEKYFNHSIELAIVMAKKIDRRVSSGSEVNALSNDMGFGPIG